MAAETEVEDTPHARIRAAVAGKPARSYSEILAADVVAVAEAIPAGKHNTITTALRNGAAAALAETRQPHDQFTVHQVTGQLAHLLHVAEEATRDGAQNPVPESS